MTLLGLDDVVIDKQATVTGVKSDNRPGALRIGFIAHLARFSPAVPDFDLQAFHDRQQQTLAVAAEISSRYPDENVTVTLNDVYSNAPGEYRLAIELLLQALAALAVVPKIIPMRGGTDGAALSA